MGGMLSKSSNPFAEMEGPEDMFLRSHCDSVFAIAHSPDGRRLASTGADRTVIIWDIHKGKQRKTLVGHLAPVNAIQYGPAGTILASGGDDKIIMLWNVKTGAKLQEMPSDREKLQGRASVNALAFSDDGRFLASAHGSPRDNDNTIRIWEIKKGEEIMSPLTGHASFVTSVAYCDDFLASGSFDGMIKVWNARTGELKHSLRSQTGIILCVAFSPDGMFVAAGEGCSTSAARPSILLWETNRGSPVGVPLQGHTASIRSLTYSPDGTMLISGGEDGTIRTWRPHLRKYVGMITGHVAVVSSVSVSPDQQFISSGSEDRSARLISLAYTPKSRMFKKEKCMLCGCTRKEHHDERLTCLPYITPHVIPDHPLNFNHEVAGKKLKNDNSETFTDEAQVEKGRERKNSITDSDNQHASISSKSPVPESPNGKPDDVVNGQDADKIPPLNRLVSFGGGEKPIAADQVAASKKSKSLIASIAAKRASLTSKRRSRSSREDIYEIGTDEDQSEHNSTPSTLRSRGKRRDGTSDRGSREGSVTAASASDQIDLATTDVADDASEEGSQDTAVTFKGTQQSLLSVACNPDGRTLVTGSADASIVLWDAAKQKQRGAHFVGHSDAILSLAYNPNGDIVASGSADETAILWDARTGRQLREPFLGHSDRVWSVAFSPCGQTLITGGGDAMIILWETKTGQPKGYPLEGHTDWVGRAVFSPDGKSIASGGGDKSVRLWDTESGEQKMELSSHSDFVYTLAYSPDGSMLASGSRDKLICLWNPKDGSFVMPPLQGHSEAVLSLCFLKNVAGTFIVSGSYDRSVNLWNVADGSLVHSFRGHRKAVVCVCNTPDGTAIASASLDMTMKLWSLHGILDLAADITEDNTAREDNDFSYTEEGTEDGDFYSEMYSTDVDGESVATYESDRLEPDQRTSRNAFRIGGFVGIAMQRFAHAGAERANRRQMEIHSHRSRSSSLHSVAEVAENGLEHLDDLPGMNGARPMNGKRDLKVVKEIARRKIKAGILAVQAARRFAEAGKAAAEKSLGKPTGEKLDIPRSQTPTSQSSRKGSNTKEDENRRAAVLWFNCSLQAASANDLAPALQLSEVGIALCQDKILYEQELALLKEVQVTVRRAMSRSTDPNQWSPEDVSDFIRLTTGQLNLQLRESIDGRRLVQCSVESLLQLTGLQNTELLKNVRAVLADIAFKSETLNILSQDGSQSPTLTDQGSAKNGSGSDAKQNVEVSYEVIVGSNTFEIFPDNPSSPNLATLSDIKNAIVDHIGDADILSKNDDFRLMRVDVQTGRDMAMGQNTRAVELMIIQGRRPVFKVVDVKPKR